MRLQSVAFRRRRSRTFARICRRRSRLTRLIKEEPAESFPRGSLRKYFTPAKAEEELALLKGCSLEVPE